MDKIAKWFEDVAGDEKIISAVIGHYNRDKDHVFNAAPIGKVLSWDDARQFLAYDFHSGYGAPECHSVYAWTATRVLFISEYDGSTEPAAVPRNPIECAPEFDGFFDYASRQYDLDQMSTR